MKNKLKINYEKACEAYLEAFCEKHDYCYEDNMWVGNKIGGFAEVADLYVGIDDIRIDIDKNAPEDEFVKWYNYSLRLGMLNATTPNYESWLNKCPIKSEEEIVELEGLKLKIDGLKEELERMCKN